MQGKLLLTTFVVLALSAGTLGQASSSESSSSSSSSEGEPDPRTDDCSIDVVLVLDDSSSITPRLFRAARMLMNAFIACFGDTDDVNGSRHNVNGTDQGTPDSNPVGVVLYNCEARTEISLGTYTASNHYLMYAIGGLRQQGGVTRTGPAIRYMKDTSTFRDGARRVAIVFTDGYIEGEPLDDHVAEANAARTAGITLYSVGLGDNVDRGVLEEIAGSPGNVFDDTDNPCDLAEQILQDCDPRGGASDNNSDSYSDDDSDDSGGDSGGD
ncbi:MATN4 [Branchiostoma lanceolatum]|uniref:MATN4 protein n=1 Tax=Branchiostoma lanceolatum TaxID=7740 RepID=A0A8K0F1K0_BRALA|nr:MATN4 [Branchiostoma lanceolatum]